jgi:hypothetical protein
MSNLAENIKAVRRELGDKILSSDEVAKFADLWRRWLVFGNKLGTGLAPMSSTVRREWAGLLGEGWQLYERFRLLGLCRVAPPYHGELAVILVTLPEEESLTGMSARLLDAGRVSEKLLDQGAPWWAWRQRPADPGALIQAIGIARQLAQQISEVARTAPGEGKRDRGAPIYAKVIGVLQGLYQSASWLYDGRERPGRGRWATEESFPGQPERVEVPRTNLLSIGKYLAVGGIGYLGIKWLMGGKKENVARNTTPGYHPGVRRFDDQDIEDNEDNDDEQPDEGS